MDAAPGHGAGHRGAAFASLPRSGSPGAEGLPWTRPAPGGGFGAAGAATAQRGCGWQHAQTGGTSLPTSAQKPLGCRQWMLLKMQVQTLSAVWQQPRGGSRQTLLHRCC